MATIPPQLIGMGKEMCKRAGLDPNKVKQEWTFEDSGGDVRVYLTVVEIVPREEFVAALRKFERAE